MAGSTASPLRQKLRQLKVIVLARGNPQRVKAISELRFWQSKKASEGTLGNEHFEYFFTGLFGLSTADFDGKRMLDIGCGPRGSLEWADGAAERVGLDPLVDDYRALGIDQHAMRYVCAPAEKIPFPDGHFDVVSSLNSLDHVDELDATINEIKRVMASGGFLLIITDVNHEPTMTEPISFSWDVIDRFKPEFEVVAESHLEKGGEAVYDSVKAAVAYDDSDGRKRYGILVARLRRIGG